MLRFVILQLLYSYKCMAVQRRFGDASQVNPLLIPGLARPKPDHVGGLGKYLSGAVPYFRC